MTMDRRAFLSRTLGLGCSLAASPLVTPMSFAAAPGDNRLVVIILRGGMDGLGVVQPYGDPNYQNLGRKSDLDSAEGSADLDGFYALHNGLRPLLPLWQQGQLGFVHAVSTPYRDKRSHFDGQDLLEAGTVGIAGVRDGWLNRLLAHLPGSAMDTAYAIGNDALAILDGPAPVARWSPETDLVMSPQAMHLAQLVMQDDPAMSSALAEAFQLAASDGDGVAIDGGPQQMMQMMQADARAARQSGNRLVAEFAASRLRQEARIAAFSLNGWDTHINQDRGLMRPLTNLCDAILALQDSLGAEIWAKTAIVAMTEFGRTARMNGTKGTDHGTGGAMVLAGGAVRGGRVVSDWPGLAEAELYARRDLAPTRDLRAHAAWLLRGLFGIDATTLERDVFPGVELGSNPGLLL
ncbi:DUF1501 domain-containing protein [Primorskyibacter sp. 2E233]|uniref:DUF1501 domain-containing protein n=1 Tax=Primorskyibacter sp. 2E233 TaxID=3413431 RepID=UPI003BF27253